MSYARILLSTLVVALCAAVGAVESAAQTTWWVQSADYGAGNKRQDVTNTVRRLANGPNFKVNNTNLGVDPAVGKDKTLRIVGRDSSGKVRDFYYKEGVTVNARMFAGGPGSSYPGWAGTAPEKPGIWRIKITSARWGFGAQQQDVTGDLQDLVRNNRLNIKVTPQTMGGDPAPGKSKTLTVSYLYGNQRKNKTVPEGGTLTLP